MKNSISFLYRGKATLISAILLCTSIAAKAQIAANAVNADPSAKSITQVPLGSNINGMAVMKFKFTNEATSVNLTGQIPANSVRLTISFPGQYTYHSVNSIPKFVVEDAETTPFGVVHLVNNALILEGEVVDLLLNVKGVTPGSGTVTFNADRITPIIVGNTQTSNDNASSIFVTIGVLPLKLLGFNVQKQDCTADLVWKTANEENVAGFEVEMSNDNGASFTVVEKVAASNGNSYNTYSYRYQMQGNAAYLFRLRIIGKGGDVTYSTIARLNAGCSSDKNTVQVYPSPARSVITLNITDQSLVNSKATVIDVNGKVHMSFNITGTTMKAPVDKLPAGIYIIRLVNGAAVKFMKE